MSAQAQRNAKDTIIKYTTWEQTNIDTLYKNNPAYQNKTFGYEDKCVYNEGCVKIPKIESQKKVWLKYIINNINILKKNNKTISDASINKFIDDNKSLFPKSSTGEGKSRRRRKRKKRKSRKKKRRTKKRKSRRRRRRRRTKRRR